MTPLERAARALQAEHGPDWPYVYNDDMKDYVRAVLKAIRVPSEAMKWAGANKADDIYEGDAGIIWQAMIDAALAE